MISFCLSLFLWCYQYIIIKKAYVQYISQSQWTPHQHSSLQNEVVCLHGGEVSIQINKLSHS